MDELSKTSARIRRMRRAALDGAAKYARTNSLRAYQDADNARAACRVLNRGKPTEALVREKQADMFEDMGAAWAWLAEHLDAMEESELDD